MHGVTCRVYNTYSNSFPSCTPHEKVDRKSEYVNARIASDDETVVLCHHQIDLERLECKTNNGVNDANVWNRDTILTHMDVIGHRHDTKSLYLFPRHSRH